MHFRRCERNVYRIEQAIIGQLFLSFQEAHEARVLGLSHVNKRFYRFKSDDAILYGVVYTRILKLVSQLTMAVASVGFIR